MSWKIFLLGFPIAGLTGWFDAQAGGAIAFTTCLLVFLGVVFSSTNDRLR